MSISTPTVGYPVHVVDSYRQETSPNNLLLTDWTARCGLTGRAVGINPFRPAGNSRKLERCQQCFPGRDIHTYFPPPERLT